MCAAAVQLTRKSSPGEKSILIGVGGEGKKV
jgi:hypothetical protein